MRKVGGRAGVLAGILVGVLLASCACAAALDPSLDISQYAHTAWKVRDGFTRGGINTIAQTPDGYLWLGTEFGLYRFDGVRAVQWQPPQGTRLPSEYISDLLVSRDGTLWIGTRKGLASWKDGRLTEYPELEGQPSGRLFLDRHGGVWAGLYSPGRICQLENGNARCEGSGTLGEGVFCFYEDRQGQLWACAWNGLWRWAPGVSQQYSYGRQLEEINSIAEDDSGVLLLATNNGLKQLKNETIEEYTLPGIGGKFRPTCFLRSSDGSLWIGTMQGLFHLHRGRIDRFSAADGLSGDFVSGIFEDREGSVWVATLNGINRFRDVAVPRISRNQGLSNTAAWSVQASPDGSTWIGAPNGLNRWMNGEMTVYRSGNSVNRTPTPVNQEPRPTKGATEIENSGLQGNPHSLGLDDAGRLWVATREGVFYFEAGRFVGARGVSPGFVSSISGDGRGKTWIFGSAGLFYWSPSTGIVQQIPISQFGEGEPRSMVADQPQGGLWLGFFRRGISYLKQDQALVSYSAANGLVGGRVSQLRLDARNVLWAATDGGLSRIEDGHVVTLGSKNGLPCDSTHWSIADDNQAVWLYMPCGLVRIEHSELDAWVSDPKHVLKTTVFDSSDGVQSIAEYGGFGPHVTKTADGKILFVATEDVSVIDPHHLAFNKLPPPVHIEQVTADDKTYEATNGLRLPPHVRDLAIDYTALSFVAPEKVRFRYKLEGEDKDWREVVNKREVQYTNLGPKHYRFRVLACNNSGVWNEQGASLEFVIPPAWYQTNWFYALCAATFLLMLWGLYHLRVLQLRREFNAALEARVGERTRVARDLHDTLLQSFHALLLRFAVVQRLLPGRVEEAERELQRAMELATAAITEGRDAVQGLRDSTIESNDLVRAIQTIGEGLAGKETNQSSASFAVRVEGASRELRPLLRDEVYRIATESLRNAFRHANASRIEAEIRYGEKQFRLRIIDDGKGIDPAFLTGDGREGHYGMRGMRERAQLVGGKLAVWSELNGGTEVELTIPARNAYEAAQRSWWRAQRSAKESDAEETKIES